MKRQSLVFRKQSTGGRRVLRCLADTPTHCTSLDDVSRAHSAPKMKFYGMFATWSSPMFGSLLQLLAISLEYLP